MIKRDFPNHIAFNLDKRAPIGYNAPISRARLEVIIMLHETLRPSTPVAGALIPRQGVLLMRVQSVYPI